MLEREASRRCRLNRTGHERRPGTGALMRSGLTSVLACLVAFAAPDLQAQSQSRITHTGQSPRDHVTLEVVGGVQCGCEEAEALLDFIRVLPNGKATGNFRVPSGAFLVVTDVDWQYIHPDGSAGAEGIQILRLFIQNRREPSTCSRAFESTVVLSGLGQGGTSESMTSGFVVAAGSRICPDVIPGPMGPPAGLQHLILRGYLVRL